MKLFGFAGPMGCGKTTCAKAISHAVCSFALPMKNCLQDLFGFEDNQLYTMEGKQAVDPRYGVSPRLIMQRFGTEFVRTTVPDLWIILMRTTLGNLREVADIACVDDIRFNDEAALIREMGGTVVHIVGRVGVESNHASELGIVIHSSDIIFDNKPGLLSLPMRLRNRLNI